MSQTLPKIGVKQGAATVPTCGRAFLAVLNDGQKVVMRRPADETGFHDYWVVQSGVRVPIPETICTEARGEFMHIVGWYEMPADDGVNEPVIGWPEQFKYNGGE